MKGFSIAFFPSSWRFGPWVKLHKTLFAIGPLRLVYHHNVTGAWGEDPSPIVYVVMGNDYPDAVFTTEVAASAYCSDKKAQTGRRVHWRYYAFRLPGKRYRLLNEETP